MTTTKKCLQVNQPHITFVVILFLNKNGQTAMIPQFNQTVFAILAQLHIFELFVKG